MTKSKFCAVFFCVILSLLIAVGQVFAAAQGTVHNAEELQKALDDGEITDIAIGASIKGNFLVPRWIHSISGTGKNVVISPVDENKPIFDAETRASRRSKLFSRTAKTLEFRDMTIDCGKNVGIDLGELAKPVTLKNIVFNGRGKNVEATGCYPSTNTTFDNCSFYSLYWAVSANWTSEYDITIQNCSFGKVNQAFSNNASTSIYAEAKIVRCKGENVGYWVIIHNPDSRISVTVDQATIDSMPGSDFWHKITEEMKSNQTYDALQFNSCLEDLQKALKKLPSDVQKVIVTKKQKGSWDATRLFAFGELQRRLPKIDFNDSSLSKRDIKEEIGYCVALYALLASAPVSEFITPKVELDFKLLDDFFIREMTSLLKDKNLVHPALTMFFHPSDWAVLGLASGNINWGNTGNVRKAIASAQDIDTLPDRLFRDNIHRLQDWLSALEKVRSSMSELQKEVIQSFHDDFSYITELDTNLRNISDLSVSSSRVARALLFDFPMDIVFVINYAQVTAENKDNRDRIIQIARKIGPLYSVSQRLCVLRRTNTLRAELDKTWKEALTVKGFFSGDDHSKYETLKSYLATDSDLMRDATRLEKFFDEWR